MRVSTNVTGIPLSHKGLKTYPETGISKSQQGIRANRSPQRSPQADTNPQGVTVANINLQGQTQIR